MKRTEDYLTSGVVMVGILAITVFALFVSHAVLGWSSIFDDAFISYRYAKNIALGYGVTWNPGGAPTEGYTNFLLVIILAPFIRLGFDPLLITRILSYLAALAIASLLYRVARVSWRASLVEAVLVAGLVLITPQTSLLCLLGLETVMYAFALLCAFHFAVESFRSPAARWPWLFMATSLVSMLLRPEAALLVLVYLVVWTLKSRHQALSLKRHFIAAIFSALIIGGAYLLWKQMYYGDILPNPFYLKVARVSLYSPYGLRSVGSFFLFYAVLSLFFLLGLLQWVRENNSEIKDAVIPLALGLVVFYSLFFARSDTLMDAHGRFMYPLLAIIIYSSIPAVLRGMIAVQRALKGCGILGPPLFVAIVFWLFGLQGALEIARNVSALRGYGTDNHVSDPLMQKEKQIAQRLAPFPDIKNVRIAFGDAGVIAYETGAIWLDTVGLNDSFIARTRELPVLVDYFFDFQADLVMLPTNKDHSLISYGHGPLGDYSQWALDPRWAQYEYVGTSIVEGPSYDIQFFVRSSSKYERELSSYLRSRVVDGWYSLSPFRLGTGNSDSEKVSSPYEGGAVRAPTTWVSMSTPFGP